ERVFLVWKLAEHCHRGFNDVLNVGSHLWRAQRNIRFTEYETMMGSSGFEFENLEIADERRGINEDVVIGRRVSIALFFESGIYLPAAWCVEFDAAWNVFLTDDVHKRGRWRDVGHLIVQQW